MKELIEIKKLTKAYNNFHVLDKINVSIKHREFVSVIGPSGCGKTTLLKIIGGILEPTEGEIVIKGTTPGVALKRKELGFVFQSPILLPWRNALENIELPLEVPSYKKSQSLPRELLEIMGLKGFENFYPEELSGGMKQRIAMARALIFKPSILLMDEPFNSLDEITRDKMQLELLQIWEEKK